MNWIYAKQQPHSNNRALVKVIAQIRNNATGEIREYETEEFLDASEETPSVFNWEENNLSCDCVRHLLFNRALGKETTNDTDVECSDGKYSVNLKNPFDDKFYYQEY